MKLWLAAGFTLVISACAAAPAALPTHAISASIPAGALPARQDLFEGRNTVRFVPTSPRGIVFLFHGSGGSERYATNPTTRAVLALLASKGYGYAASASLQRTAPKRWDLTSADPAANPDIAFMLDLHKHLVDAGEIRSDTPVFTMGMSNGGGFANLFASAAKAQGLPVKAVADYSGPFPAPMAPMIERGFVPPATFVVIGEHDGLVDHKATLANAEKVRRAGARVETHLTTETALKPDAFTSIEGVDAKASAAIFADLVTRGLIDKDGRRLVLKDHPVITREDEEALLGRLPADANRREIHRVLVTVWAGHMMRSDFAAQQVAFFEAAR